MKKYSKLLCFEDKTLVRTETDVLQIKDIQPGSHIISYDEKLKKTCTDIVVCTAKSLHSRCAIISFEDGSSLKSTIDHPLYVVGKGWCSVNIDGLKEMYGVSVRQLEAGDVCLSLEGGKISRLKIQSIEVKPCSELFYCLATKNNHSFFANGILAHDVDINRFSQEDLIREGVVVERMLE